MSFEKLDLEAIRKRSYDITSHYLRSSNDSTKVLLVATYSLLNNVSRMTKHGDVSSCGIDPSCMEAQVYAWADGISKQIGDRELCAALLGAMQRAVETLESATGLES